MKITIESTDRLCDVNGHATRVWEGQTESGIRVYCLVTRVAVHKDEDASQFEAELQEVTPASEEALRVFPLSMAI